MIGKSTAMGLMLVAGTVLAGGRGNRVIVVDDFNDGDASGWEETDFTAGRGSFTVVGGKYVLQTTEPIAIDDPSVGALDADWEPSMENPMFSNGTVRGTIRANTYGTTVGFLLRDSHETESDYGFFGSTSFGTFYIERFELLAHPEAPQTILAMADPEDFPFAAGEDWNIEARVIGRQLRMWAWKVGDQRPRRPLLSVADKVLGPDSGSGIAAIAFFGPAPLISQGVTEVQVSGTVDNITFTPGRGRNRFDDDDGDGGDDD